MIENIMKVISDNRVWIMPGLLLCAIPLIHHVIADIFRNAAEDLSPELWALRKKKEQR